MEFRLQAVTWPRKRGTPNKMSQNFALGEIKKRGPEPRALNLILM
jgi:hypothetical protein